MDHVEFAVKAFEDAKFYLNKEDGWTSTFYDEEQGLYGEKTPVTWSSVEMYRGGGTVFLSPKDICDRLWSLGLDDWQKLYSDCKEWSIKETVNDHIRVVHQLNSMTWPIWGRELVVNQSRWEEDGTYYIVSRTVDDERWPYDTSNYVKCTVFLSVYIFSPVEGRDNESIATRLVQLDPNGNIPSTVVNRYAASIYDFVNKLNDNFA